MNKFLHRRLGGNPTGIFVLLVVLVSGCGFSGGGEPNEIAVELTSRNPVVADLSLTTAQRTEFKRPGEGATGIPLGLATPSHQIRQRFRPNQGVEVNEVAAEVVSVATEAGWEISPGIGEGSWCGQRDLETGVDLLEIIVVPASESRESTVLVSLIGTNVSC